MKSDDYDILKLLDETIQAQKNIEASPFFYIRVLQRLENSQNSNTGISGSYMKYLLRPIPVALLIIAGVIFGVGMIDFSSWASYKESQQSIVANEEVFNAYYQGNVDQTVYEAYYSPEINE